MQLSKQDVLATLMEPQIQLMEEPSRRFAALPLAWLRLVGHWVVNVEALSMVPPQSLKAWK